MQHRYRCSKVREAVADAGHVPGGTKRNARSVEAHTDFGITPPVMRTLLADAQTSGGLLLAVPRPTSRPGRRTDGGGDLAAVIGRIEPAAADRLISVR